MANGLSFGTSSAGSLLRSAQSAEKAYLAYQDALAKQAWDNSGYTTAAYETYMKYLNGRVSTQQAAGSSFANAQKIVTLQNTMTAAQKTYSSAQISNVSDQIIQGNATAVDKLQMIKNLWGQAAATGDQTLMQSLQYKFDSVDQQYQYEQQVAADQAKTLADANKTAQKQGFSDAFDALYHSWDNVTQASKNGDIGKVQQAMQDFATSQAPLLKKFGITLPKGATLNPGAFGQAVLNAQYQLNTMAAHVMTQEGYTSDAQKYKIAADNIVNGKTTIETPAGNMNAYDLKQWASSPNLYVPSTNADGKTTYVKTAIAGYQMVDGQPVEIGTGQLKGGYGALDTNTKNQLKTQLSKMGFSVVGDSGTGIQVQFTKQSDKWLQYNGNKTNDKLLTGNAEVTLVPQANGGFQFQDGGSIYHIALDGKGLAGGYRTDMQGKTQAIGGQYGFDQKLNTFSTNMTQSNLNQAIQGITQKQNNPVANVINGIGSAFGMGHPSMTQRAGGGFNFTDQHGQAISAAEYAQLTKTPFRNLLSVMASKGDGGARTALGFTGNDFGYDPTKVAQGSSNMNLYNALTWGAKTPTFANQVAQVNKGWF